MWLRALAVFARVVGMAIALSACSHSSHCAQIDVQVMGDQAHSSNVSGDKVRRGVGGTYLVHGADHEHAFLLTDQDARTIAAGGSVTVRTTSASGHLHEVIVRCKE
jgi:hypothetical protein